MALGLFKPTFFSLPQEEEKDLKQIFNTLTSFDLSVNIQIILLYANYFLQDNLLQLISLLRDLKCS